nr:hypothetical protein [Streptomyces pseudovenezuelae]
MDASGLAATALLRHSFHADQRVAAAAQHELLQVVDRGTPVEAACRIIVLEDQLEEAQRTNAEHRRTDPSVNPTATT